MKQVLSIVILFTSFIGVSQNNEVILTRPIYDAQYNSISDKPEELIGQLLSGTSIYHWVDQALIRRNDMRDLALPLGIHNNTFEVNFSRGMNAMWNAKERFNLTKYGKVSQEVLNFRKKINEQTEQDTTYMTLREYRSTTIQFAIDSLKDLHEIITPLYSDERRTFMNIIMANLSPNVLIGYNIQELIPPTYYSQQSGEVPINPLFKAYFLDQLLRNGGASFLSYYPARYDNLVSFGPFQFTSIAVKDVQMNPRLVNDFKLYDSIQQLKTLEDHSLMAALFAYNNWEQLAYHLQKDGTIQQFNAYFMDYENNPQTQRSLRIFIAGMTACMHHLPPRSRNMLRNYLRDGVDLGQLHTLLTEQYGSNQLKKYYRSSAEAYLIMKVYHNLILE